MAVVEYAIKQEDFNGKAGEIRPAPSGYFKGAPTFYPYPLPDTMEWSDRLIRFVTNAGDKLSELSTIGRTWRDWKGMPNPARLFEGFMKQEAVSSSRIEGTKTSYNDLLRLEAVAEAKKTGDDEVVMNLISAVGFGFNEIKKETPLSTDFLARMHQIMLKGKKGAGRIRRDQNWISVTGIEAASFIPPAPEYLPELLTEFDRYLSKENELPIIVRAALLHYQFETIHPFIDGNGRIGRALIPLYLMKQGKLSEPLLYISPYFEKYKPEYRDRLLEVSQKGTYENWIEFFVVAVTTQSSDAIERTNRLVRLHEQYLHVLKEKKFQPSADKVLDLLFQSPLTTIKEVAKNTGMTFQTAQHIMERMIREGILVETTGQKRNREYRASKIFQEYDGVSVQP